MAKCTGTKPDGTPCERIVKDSQKYCSAHAPENARKRSEVARRAGRAKPSREVKSLKVEVKQIISDVKAQQLRRADATAMLQGYRVLRDYIELERRIKETGDLEMRIAALEQQEGV
jgi:hypothetical protein